MDQAVTYPANRNLQFPVTQRHSHRTTLTQNDTHSERHSHQSGTHTRTALTPERHSLRTTLTQKDTHTQRHRTTLTQNDTHSVNEFYSHVKKDFFGCKLTRTKNMATRVG